MLRPILFVNRKSDNNIGDQLSSPYQYFGSQYPNAHHLEVHIEPGVGFKGRIRQRLKEEARDAAQVIILGGGGLIGADYFKEDIQFWADGPAPVVLWGAGHNSHNLNAVADEVPGPGDYGQLMSFTSIGIRDWGVGLPWVPCVSCMHPMITPSQGGTDTLFVFHRDSREDKAFVERVLRRAPDKHQIVFNDAPEAEIFGKLAKAKSVVTNSFHAAYWATLFRIPVAVIGGGTKVRLLKHAPAISTIDDWVEDLQNAPVHEHALEECRDRNSDFNRHIKSNFAGKWFAAPSRPEARDPVKELRQDLAAVRDPMPTTLKNKVPKVIHFIFGLSPDFGGKPFNLMHYFAVLSAIEKIRPEEIIFHHAHLPDNEFFNRVKHLMTMRKIETPEYYMGRKLEHFAHKADVVRMQILVNEGGIYMDLDTISVKSMDGILEHSFTIGLQGRERVQGLCNAVVLAAPGDPFINAWFKKYENFDAKVWDQFSVRLPYMMWRAGGHSINVESYDRFHWPLWDDESLKLMFEQDNEFPNAICHHLWESMSYKKYFLDVPFDQAISHIKESKSTYARLVRDYT